MAPKLALAVLSRSEIDAALLRNAAYTTAARGFGLVDVSVRRHSVKHIPKLISEIKQNYAIRQDIADTMAQASKPTESAERSMRVNESLVVTPIASAEEVLREISAMAMANHQDCFDKDGHLLPMRKLPEAVARACAGFEADDSGALRKIRFEKARALETLAKHYSVVAPDNRSQVSVQINVSDAQVERLNSLLSSNRPSIDVRSVKRDTVSGLAEESGKGSSVELHARPNGARSH